MALSRAKVPFRFVTKANLTQITGRKAKSLQELVHHLREVPTSVIYHHTHRFVRQHQFLSPEPANDFAYWVNTALQDERLAEKLASIDMIRYPTLRDLREKIIQTIETHMAVEKNTREALPGDELYLMQSISFILPTPYEVWTLQEFADALKKVGIHSLYHHIFEARLRLREGKGNDFSNWFENGLEEFALARAMLRMDPYTQTLESLRNRIVKMVERRAQELTYAHA